jgi:predicted lipoprotein with Yx(FWY)xxD motif
MVRRTYLTVGALVLVGLLAIAGCGGGGSSSTTPSTGAGEGGTETTANSGGERGGYGGGGYGGESSAGTAESEGGMATGAAGAATVKVMDTPKLGKVIVDSEGMTLYDFHKDKGTTSACYGACAMDWPPLLTKGSPKAMAGAQAPLLGTTKRRDGTVQVTYGGHPVYTFFEDKKPGETNGNDVDFFGGEWYALLPNAEEPEDS